MRTWSWGNKAIVIGAMAAIVPVLGARQAGEHFFGSSLAYWAATAIATVALLWMLDHTGEGIPRRTRRMVTMLAFLLPSYLALWAASGWTQASGADSWIPATLVAVAIVGHVPILALTSLLPLATVGEGRRTAICVVVLGVAAAGVGALTWERYEPFTGIASPLGTPTGLPAIVAGLIDSGFLLSLAAPAVLLLVLVRRARGARRERLAIVAMAAAATVSIVTFCSFTAAVADAGGAGDTTSIVALLVGVCAVAVVTSGGSLLASRVHPVVLRTTLVRAAQTSLTAFAGLVALATGLAIVSAGAGLFWAVVVVVAMMAAAAPLRQPFARFLLGPAPAGERQNGQVATASELSSREREVLDTLTPREREVLELLADGMTNAGIASVLVLSERTVDAHLRSIFSKLDLPGDENRRVHAALTWTRQVRQAN